MRSLLLICGLIVAVAVVAPGFVTSRLEQLAAAPERPDAPPVARPVTDGVEVKAAANGHFYIDARINRRPVRLMVDTGASVVALRQSDAAALGIRPRRADFDQPVHTANGTTYAASATLGSMEVDGILLSDVAAAVLPDDQLGVNLLGGSFLNRLRRFEVQGGTLLLEN